MTSPDLSQYVDLTVYDKQPVDIYTEAVEYARTSLPEWTPVFGSIEDALLQASASMTGELAAALNRVTDGVLEGLLLLFDIQRNTGTTPTGTITITTVDDLGYIIPAGTRFGYLDSTDPAQSVLYTFDTDADLTIGQGATIGSVAITGTTAIEYPTLSSGTTLQLLSSVSFINSASLSSSLSIGANSETDAEYLARGIAKLNSYTTALVLPDQFQQYILSTYTAVNRCKVYARRNSTADLYTDALQNGYITVYACKAAGASISGGVYEAIDTDITNRSVAGLSITVKAPPIVTVAIAVTVVAKTGYTQTVVNANVVAGLNQYLHPDYWDWSDTIYYNELISKIDQITGVERVTVLTITTPTGGHLVGGGPNIQFDKIGSLPLVSPTVTVL